MSKPGLWANIHAKRERIAAGSGERMRKPGTAGSPTAEAIKDSSDGDRKVKRALRAARGGYAAGGDVLPLDPRYLDQIKRFEGYKDKPYWDYRQWTSGYGTRASSPDEVMDRATADRRLNDELAKARAIVERFAPQAPDGVKSALTSLTYNAGGNWMKSGLGQAIAKGDYTTAQRIFTQYNKAGGKTLPGLVARRNAEAQWFNDAQPAMNQAPTLVASNDTRPVAPNGITPPAPQPAIRPVQRPPGMMGLGAMAQQPDQAPQQTMMAGYRPAQSWDQNGITWADGSMTPMGYADGGDVYDDMRGGVPMERKPGNPIIEAVARALMGSRTLRAQAETAPELAGRVTNLIREPLDALGRLATSSYRPTGEAYSPERDQMAADSFTVGSALPVAGLAAGVMPRGSVASNALRAAERETMPTYKGYHATRDANKFYGDPSDRYVPLTMWMVGARDEPAIATANSYVRTISKAPAILPVEGRFQNPMIVDAKNSRWSEIPYEGNTWKSDDLQTKARLGGHDALVLENVRDHGLTWGDEPPTRVIAALRPGTVFDDYGNQLFSNSSKASAPGLAAIESNRVRRIPDHAMAEYRQAQKYLDQSPTGRLANQMQSLVDEYWRFNPDGSPPPSPAEHKAAVDRMFSTPYKEPPPKPFEDTLEVRRNSKQSLHDIAQSNFNDYELGRGVEMAPIDTLSGGYHWNKRVEPLAAQIKENGWFEPLVVDQNGNVIEGQHRLRAMQSLGVKRVPVQRIIGLDDQ